MSGQDRLLPIIRTRPWVQVTPKTPNTYVVMPGFMSACPFLVNMPLQRVSVLPYSSASGKAWSNRLIRRIMANCRHRSILDVGAGAGFYSDDLRPRLPGVRFVAVEIWKDYILEFNLDRKYDRVLNLDIREWSPDEAFGITICGDVLEHMSKNDAIATYKKLLNSSEFIVLSIPVVPYPQGEYRGNPYERHIKDDWSHREVMESFPNIAICRVENELGVYIGWNPDLHTAAEIAEANRPIIGIYGIYKNEEKFIERFLDSTKQADEIVLCDTGSTDETNERIQRFTEKHPEAPVKTFSIHVSPWRFDDARNAALSLVGSDIDVCISMDIDEYLMEDWKAYLIRHWEYGITRYHHRFKTFWSPEHHTEHLHNRIHSRTGYTWKLPIHEILESHAEEKVKFLDDFYMFQEPDQQKSRSYYLPLLLQSVRERKDIWKSWSFLAIEYLARGEWNEARQAIETALAIADSDKAYLYLQLHEVYRNQRNSSMALLCLNNAILHLPDRREPYVKKALYLNELERNGEALFALNEAERLTSKIIDYHFTPIAWDPEFSRLKTKIGELARMESGAIS
ncbi:glycosyltransferase [Cohnella sp. CFH 77786]|uniref:glycosyltransferase n=1 Tax=Cohnella sp. CFH 77786 TaxID=2662265 RepID=UPI001C609D88|nr:glycosyltransferase [Cohnella sp. CFH 77786]MBW5446855.1 glycosyltransferase [Cohnella sp. CFH 77786]